MTRILSVAALLSLVLLAEPAWACKRRCRGVVVYPVAVPLMPRADETVLRLNLEKGQTFFQELETVTKQAMKVMSQELKQDQRQTMVMEWTTKGKNEQGLWQVGLKFVGAKMEIDIGGNKIDYDSEDNRRLTPFDDFFQKLMSLEFVLTIDAENKIRSVAGDEQFMRSLDKASPQMKLLLEKFTSYEALKSMAGPSLDPIPNRAVRVGETWTRAGALDLRPIATYRQEMVYRYEGRTDALDKISVKSKLAYESPKKGDRLPFTVKRADLKSTNGEGEVLFDRTKGRIASSTMKMNLKGDMLIVVGGMETTVTLDHTRTTTTRTSDQHPWRKER
jgi:hypothetical protein